MKTFEEKPALIFWELTQACDLVCSHCRACAKPYSDPDELNEEEGKTFIDEVAKWDGPMLILTGGDPLKHPSFWNWLEYARKKGVRVSVTPSPTLLVTNEAINKMKTLEVQRLGISLDGGSAFTHDQFRGVKGSFDRVVEIANQALQCGLSLQVNTTLTHHNVDQLTVMAERVKSFNAKMWSLFFLVPVGRGKNIKMFSPEEHEYIFEKLYALKLKFELAVKTTEAPHYRRYVMQVQNRKEGFGGGMGDGRGVLFISRRGDICPSGFLPLPVGNVKKESIREVYFASQLLCSLRNPDLFKGKCGYCEYRFLCGGSRSRAYAVTGDALESDPFCSYQPVGAVLVTKN